MEKINVILTDTKNYLKVSGEKILQLELALNKSNNGKIWSYLGDHLHSYYINFGSVSCPSNYIYVKPEQFDFLKKLYENL